jgi:hypothetical protein
LSLTELSSVEMEVPALNHLVALQSPSQLTVDALQH